MFWRYALIGWVVIYLAAPASAEFYRYRDENGVLRYTDTYMDIPIEQRRGVTPFIETEGASITEEAAEKEAAAASPAENPAAAAAAQRPDLQAVLTRKKEALDRSYAELLKERNALEKEKESVSMTDAAQAAAYRDKVISFNRRLKTYQQQLAALTREVEDFNKRAQAAETAKK